MLGTSFAPVQLTTSQTLSPSKRYFCGMLTNFPQVVVDPHSLQFYDVWVARDVEGKPLSNTPPYLAHDYSLQRLKQGLPFPVSCCWNGMLSIAAEPFRLGYRFRLPPASTPFEFKFRFHMSCSHSGRLLLDHSSDCASHLWWERSTLGSTIQSAAASIARNPPALPQCPRAWLPFSIPTTFDHGFRSNAAWLAGQERAPSAGSLRPQSCARICCVWATPTSSWTPECAWHTALTRLATCTPPRWASILAGSHANIGG